MGNRMLCVRVPEAFREAVQKEASRQFGTESSVVRQALAQFFQLSPEGMNPKSGSEQR